MSYRYLDDETVSDVGFEARAGSLNTLFVAAWEAALGLMIADPTVLRDQLRREIHCTNPDLELLLFDVLGELVYLKDAEHAFYRLESLSISTSDGGLLADGVAAGEEIDPARHDLGVDVKAVTLDQLRVWREGEEYFTRVVLDT